MSVLVIEGHDTKNAAGADSISNRLDWPAPGRGPCLSAIIVSIRYVKASYDHKILNNHKDST